MFVYKSYTGPHHNYLSVSMMYDILHGWYSSLKICITVLSIHLVPEHTPHSFSTTIPIDIIFVNTAFLWNTIPYTILTVNPPKFRYTLYWFLSYLILNFTV